MIREKLFEKLIKRKSYDNEIDNDMNSILRNKDLIQSNNLPKKKRKQLTLITFNDSSLSKTFKNENDIKPINLSVEKKKFKTIINLPSLSIPKYKFLKTETGRFFLNNNKKDNFIDSPRFSIGLISKKSKEKYNPVFGKKIEVINLKKNKRISPIKDIEIKNKKKKIKLSSIKEELTIMDNPHSIIYPLYYLAEKMKNKKIMENTYKTKLKEYKSEMVKAGIPAFKQVFLLNNQIEDGKLKIFNPNSFMNIKF